MKILVAEDDPISSMALEAQLKKQGYDVTIAADGAAAWKKFQEERFPIVITDWMMPVMDGIQLCKNIRAQGKPYACVLMLTAKQSREDKMLALSAGVDVFLSKPLSADVVIARLQVARKILEFEAA